MEYRPLQRKVRPGTRSSPAKSIRWRRRSATCSSGKSSPTTPVRRTGARNEAATEKNEAAPPSTSSRRAVVVSTESSATEPTTSKGDDDPSDTGTDDMEAASSTNWQQSCVQPTPSRGVGRSGMMARPWPRCPMRWGCCCRRGIMWARPDGPRRWETCVGPSSCTSGSGGSRRRFPWPSGWETAAWPSGWRWMRGPRIEPWTSPPRSRPAPAPSWRPAARRSPPADAGLRRRSWPNGAAPPSGRRPSTSGAAPSSRQPAPWRRPVSGTRRGGCTRSWPNRRPGTGSPSWPPRPASRWARCWAASVVRETPPAPCRPRPAIPAPSCWPSGACASSSRCWGCTTPPRRLPAVCNENTRSCPTAPPPSPRWSCRRPPVGSSRPSPCVGSPTSR